MNTNRSLCRLIPLLLLTLLLLSCEGGTLTSALRNTVTVTLVYGSEKQEWLEPLVQEYNQAQHQTADGATIVIEATPMGSIEPIELMLSGQLQPTVWSPASSVYVPVANLKWREKNSGDLVTGTPKDLVLSPVVIAMWRPMAEALGWPDKPLGWADISGLATAEEGWATYNYPEWGQFKLGHTHPDFSNSGLVSILTTAYAGAGKQRGLTQDDLNSPQVAELMGAVESSIIHYGRSTGFFAEQMFERGPSYLSAAVLYENLVVTQEQKRLSGQSQQIPVVAIYPKEGTFWTNNPYIILNAPWVTEAQKAAAQDFETFLLAEPQQRRAMEYGFRPADPAIPLAAPLDSEHGVDPAQPQTVLEVPDAEVIQGVQYLWGQVKRPVDLVLVVDTSGSMAGDKIAAARTSLTRFVDLLDNQDRLQVLIFNTQATVLTPLTPLADKREDVKRRVSGLIEGGDTSLYDATLQAYEELKAIGDPKHIRAVVVLSDGADTSSIRTLTELITQTGNIGEEGGNAIKLFTIAYGGDADTTILQQIAEATGGRQFSGDPATIDQVYAEIALFF